MTTGEKHGRNDVTNKTLVRYAIQRNKQSDIHEMKNIITMNEKWFLSKRYHLSIFLSIRNGKRKASVIQYPFQVNCVKKSEKVFRQRLLTFNEIIYTQLAGSAEWLERLDVLCCSVGPRVSLSLSVSGLRASFRRTVLCVRELTKMKLKTGDYFSLLFDLMHLIVNERGKRIWIFVFFSLVLSCMRLLPV